MAQVGLSVQPWMTLNSWTSACCLFTVGIGGLSHPACFYGAGESKPGLRTCQQALYRLSYILSPGTAIFKTSILTWYNSKIYSQDTYKLSGDSGKILKAFVFHNESICLYEPETICTTDSHCDLLHTIVSTFSGSVLGSVPWCCTVWQPAQCKVHRSCVQNQGFRGVAQCSMGADCQNHLGFMTHLTLN